MSALPKLLASTRMSLDKLAVLIVDDNAQSLDILVQVVSGFGVKTLVRCDSAADAQTQLAKAPYDLVLTDAQMPGMDGYSLVQWIRRDAMQQNRFIPVVVITGHTRQQDVLRARDCGANFTIAKPITPKVILERIFWIAKEDRMFVETGDYVGPDRRFKREGPPAGMKGRRSDDLDGEVGTATTPNLSQDQIDSLMKPGKVAI